MDVRARIARGTVRSASSATSIKSTLSEYSSRLSFAIVPDIASEMMSPITMVKNARPSSAN